MALQFSTTLRNGRADQLTSVIGGTAKLRFYTGSAPADCATAATGTLLAELTCNATFAAAASGGVLTLNAVTAANASATGTAGYFRIYNSAGSTCHMQGTVGTSGTDAIVDSTSFTSGVQVSVTSWTFTEQGA